MIEHMTGDVKDTKRRLFPHHPEPPEPSSIKTSELTGTYHDAGYGGFSLREETHPENLDETILVPVRDYGLNPAFSSFTSPPLSVTRSVTRPVLPARSSESLVRPAPLPP